MIFPDRKDDRFSNIKARFRVEVDLDVIAKLGQVGPRMLPSRIDNKTSIPRLRASPPPVRDFRMYAKNAQL